MGLYAYVGGNPVNFIDPLGLSDDDNVIPFPPKKGKEPPKCETLTCEEGARVLSTLRYLIVVNHEDGHYNDIQYENAKREFNERLFAFTEECPEEGSLIPPL